MKAVFAVISVFVFLNVGCWLFDLLPAELFVALAFVGLVGVLIALFMWGARGNK